LRLPLAASYEAIPDAEQRIIDALHPGAMRLRTDSKSLLR
jgi:hypothetical protein